MYKRRRKHSRLPNKLTEVLEYFAQSRFRQMDQGGRGPDCSDRVSAQRQASGIGPDEPEPCRSTPRISQKWPGQIDADRSKVLSFQVTEILPRPAAEIQDQAVRSTETQQRAEKGRQAIPSASPLTKILVEMRLVGRLSLCSDTRKAVPLSATG